MVEPSKSKSERARIKLRAGTRLQGVRRQSGCEIQSTNGPLQEASRDRSQEEIALIDIEENNKIGPCKKDPRQLNNESGPDLDENASSVDVSGHHGQLQDHDDADDSEKSED